MSRNTCTCIWLRGACILVACLLLGSVVAPAQSAEKYPSRPIDLIVPYTPGGGVDITGRLVAGYVSKKWGVPVNVVNMPGGSTVVGARHVMASKPDGYALLVDSHGSSTMLAATETDLPFKWDERTFIARVAVEPIFYVVRPDGPWKSLKDLAENIRQKPKTLRWGVAGLAGFGTFAVGQFLDVNGLSQDSAFRVAFKSGADSLTNVAGGHVDFAAQGYAESASFIAGKTVRALAAISEKRLAGFPDVPTVAEAGYANLNVNGWQGIAGPRGLPNDIIVEWNKVLSTAMQDKDFLEQARKMYKQLAYLPAKEFADALKAEYDRYVPMATKMGIRK
jgi:tripartite-type tricarboxylate transporter receptor subunit TctC